MFPYGTMVSHEIEDEKLAVRLNHDIDLRDNLKDGILEKLKDAELDFDITIWNGEVSVVVDLADIVSGVAGTVEDFEFERKHSWDEESNTWVAKGTDDDDYDFEDEDI